MTVVSPPRSPHALRSRVEGVFVGEGSELDSLDAGPTMGGACPSCGSNNTGGTIDSNGKKTEFCLSCNAEW